MSIHKKPDGAYELRWREGGRNKSLRVHGSFELAKKIERKKMGVRDENRHLDIKRESNFRMAALIDRYWTHYGVKKRSATRERACWKASDQSWAVLSFGKSTASLSDAGTRI